MLLCCDCQPLSYYIDPYQSRFRSWREPARQVFVPPLFRVQKNPIFPGRVPSTLPGRVAPVLIGQPNDHSRRIAYRNERPFVDRMPRVPSPLETRGTIAGRVFVGSPDAHLLRGRR